MAEKYIDTDGNVWEYVPAKDDPVPAGLLLDLYGTCAMGPNCICLKRGNTWYGRLCASWRSNGWLTYDDMLKFHQERK